MTQLEPFRKVRRIELTQRSNRGIIPTPKNLADQFVEFESMIEQRLYILLIHDPHCIDLESQPVEVPNLDPSNPPFIPDTWAKFDTGVEVIFDVKPESYFESFIQDLDEKSKWELRKSAIESFCKIHNLRYMILTEKDLLSPRLTNVEAFRYFNQELPLLEIVKPLIEHILKEQELNSLDLAQLISKILSESVDEIIQPINQLIYQDYFLLDFDSEIKSNQTKLRLKSEKPSAIIPLYEYLQQNMQKRNALQQNASPSLLMANVQVPILNKIYDQLTYREITVLPIEHQNKINHRMELLEIFNKDNLTKSELREFAKQHNINPATLYRWKRTI